MQSEWPSVTLTPTNISQTYLDLVEALELPSLRTNMTRTQFKTATNLDIKVNAEQDKRTK